MVITSRTRVSMSHQRSIEIGPLDAPSMFHFCQEYLARLRLPLTRDVESMLQHGLIDMLNQWFEGDETTCLLVRLYIDDAISRTIQMPEQLAANAPVVVLRYVQRLTGTSEDSPVITVGKAAARTLLTAEFVPGSMMREALLQKLDPAGRDPSIGECLDKLMNSGIMEKRPVAGTVYIGYAYDPVAEFLASISYCEEYRQQPRQAWQRLVAQLLRVQPQAAGFLLALRTSLRTYQDPLQLPPHMQIDRPTTTVSGS